MKRKLSFSGFLCLFVIVLNAQKSGAILRGGLNLANVSVTDNGKVDDAKMLASFQVGIIGDLNVSDFFAIQPGFLVTGKGSKTQDGEPSDANYFKATTNPIYLEVPVNFVFKGPISKDTKFFGGAGPYIAIGIAGKNKTEGKFLGTSFSSEKDIEWSNGRCSNVNTTASVPIDLTAA